MPDTVAELDHDVSEARQAELNAWNAGNSRAAKRYADLYDALLELRPMVAVQERIDQGHAPVLA